MSLWPRQRPHLFGPIFFYDLIRSSRRGRFLALRFAYACCLLVFLLAAYLPWYSSHLSAVLHERQLAQFASSFFLWLMLVQYLCILILTPAYTAGVIAEERERQTLDALLLTGLSTHEIVCGYYLARVAKLGMVLLTAVPVVAVLQFVGGIEPKLALAGFVACGLTLLSLSTLSVLQSVLSQSPRQAIVRAYGIVLGYLSISSMSRLLLIPTLGIADFPNGSQWFSPITLSDFVDWLGAGNLFLAASQIYDALTGKTARPNVIPELLVAYAWFHGAVIVLCGALTLLRLHKPAPDSSTWIQPSKIHEPSWNAEALLDRWPVVWKEFLADVRSRARWRLRLLQGLVIALLFWPGVHICYCFGRIIPTRPGEPLGELLNLWLRSALCLLGCFMLLQVAMRASGSMARERGGQTLDILFTTPLSNRAILVGKWVSSVCAPGLAGLLVLVLCAIGVWTGALNFHAAIGWLISWLVFAGFLASLGLWFSIQSRSSWRAMLGTMTTVLAVHLGGWLAGGYVNEEHWTSAEINSFLPAHLLFTQAFSNRELDEWWLGRLPFRLWLFPIAWLLALLAALIIGKLVRERFDVIFERRERGKPPEPASYLWGEIRWSWPRPCWGVWVRRGSALIPALLPLAGLVAVYVHQQRAADRELRGLIAEIEAKDSPVDVNELAARRVVVPESHEGACLFDEIMQNAPMDGFPDGFLGEFRRGETKVVTDWMKRSSAHAGWREKIRQLKDYPHIRYFQYFELVELERWLTVDALLLCGDRDFDTGFDSIHALLNLAQTLGDYPSLTNLQWRALMQMRLLQLLERCLEMGQPSSKAMLMLQEALEGPDARDLFVGYLRAERARIDARIRLRQEGSHFGPEPLLGAERHPEFGFPLLPLEAELPLLLSGSMKQVRKDLLQAYSDLIEAVKHTSKKREVLLKAADWKWNKNPLLRRWLFQNAEFIMHLLLYGQAAQDCARLGLALEWFRLAHGRWPVHLQELVPQFIPSIPADPFDGRPMRYARYPHRVEVFSVGAELPDEVVAQGRLYGQTGPIEFRLVNPEQRRSGRIHSPFPMP